MTRRKIPTEYRSQRRRARGDKKPPFKLQPRDLDMLQAVYLNRVLTRELLMIRFPPDLNRTPPHGKTAHPKQPGTNLDRRLAALFHHSYLDRKRLSPFAVSRERDEKQGKPKRITGALGNQLIYALADAGAALLRVARPNLKLSATKWSERNRTLSEQYIEHALMTARVCLSVSVAIEATAPLTLGTFQRDSHKKDQKLAAKWKDEHRKKITLVPDALFSLTDPTRPAGQNRLVFFLEADRSTMTLERMAEKYRRYTELLTGSDDDGRKLLEKFYGVRRATILTVTKSDQRAENLADLIAGKSAIASPVPVPLRKHFFFTSETSYTDHPKNFLATVWHRGDDPGHRTGVIPSPLPRTS
jgi:hypothetical protein